MDYINMAILVVILIALAVILFKKEAPDHQLEDQKELQSELKIYLNKEYSELRLELNKMMNESNRASQQDLELFKDRMMHAIDNQFIKINEKVETKLGQGFETTQKTFISVIERLSKIDEAQKNIEKLSSEVLSLNDILTDKKTRGIFGEVQLYQLLSAVMGDNDTLYAKQKKLSNGNIADAVVYAPDPLGTIIVDSKFPLDNYKRMTNKELSILEREQATKEFKADVKKHVNAIKDKYIIKDVTSDQAIMFIPAEAIFAEILAYHEDLVEYAQKHHIWIVSPTTLISTLTIIQTVTKNIERDQQAKEIIKELSKLGQEFKRYSDRWDKLKRSIETVSKDAESVSITSGKISKKFEYISDVKFDQIETEEEE